MRNNVILVIDQSGSMAPLREAVVRAVNNIQDSWVRSSRTAGQEVLVTALVFADIHNTRYVGLPLRDYRPTGNTAMFDAVKKVINTPRDKNPGDSFVVQVLTDGFENSSRTRGPELSGLMLSMQALGNWTFTFMVPEKGNGRDELMGLGIPGGNIGTWDGTTEQSLAAAAMATDVGTRSYVTARSAGKTQVDNFYHKVTTDLSGVTKANLKDLDFLWLSTREVTKETSVREFVESWRGTPYVIGQAYYQLTKPEVIQPNKSLLVVEKGTKLPVYGGPRVRSLLGIPEDGRKARVNPGNHANYDIFVQSTSVNRKLVRGTRVYLDTAQTQVSPTWDHTKGGKA